MIAFQSLSLKLLTCRRKHTLQDFHQVQGRVCPSSIRCTGDGNLLTTRRWSIRSKGSVPTNRDKVFFWSLSHILNSTLAWSSSLVPLTHHCSTGLNGHRCRRLPDSQLDNLLSGTVEEMEQAFLALLTGHMYAIFS